LIAVKKYPASNISIEGGLKINQLQKRTDIICYKNGKPYLLVECKAPEVAINQKVFDQLFRYNQEVKAPLIVVTNGLKHVYAQVSNYDLTFLTVLTNYHDLI
jgi:hypothetical protein